ncbi:hypothetical protein EWM64_g96 [Hericium alpestre]|uniref:Arrestin-like N-terminal domain-containing protein n=1 Tax=Hericium alpestre TaxID=135208 RepID=A0A4Z0AD98_9AGAM|nr:hypothetical protein EWM64_g96 [Hericium alpestre]
MALQSRPEPMNASPYHPKVKVSLTTSDKLYVAGGAVTGKMEVECRADKGLGLGIIMVELYAIEELTSRDHSATSTFLHTRRLFQGPGLPPSNAVLPHPIAGNPPLPAHYHEARRGLTTFLFRLPIPSTSPSSIDFGFGLARIKYEVRATVGVSWKGENRLVVDRGEVDVAESYELDFDRIEPEGVIVGEHEARTVKGGDRQGDEEAHVLKEPLFEVRCFVNVKICMPIGSKDIQLDLPITIFHPAALPPPPPIPELPLPLPASPPIYDLPSPFSPPPTFALDRVQSPHVYPFTPPPQQPLPYYNAMQEQQQYWNFLQSTSPRPLDYPYPSPPSPYQAHPYYPAIPMQYAPPPRPLSAEPPSTVPLQALPSGLPPLSNQHVLMSIAANAGCTSAEPQEGKGERASRVSHHLRTTSRHRSVSPQSHRFPMPTATAQLHYAPVPVADAVPSPQISPSHVSLSPSQSLSPHSPRGQADVLSPRPLASPKRSRKISFDPATGLSLSKSDRVAALEEMAAAEEQQEHMKPELDLEKMLPSPPIPSGKDRLMLRASRPRADMLFASQDEQEAPVPQSLGDVSAPTPKTPTLSALSMLKPPRSANHANNLSPRNAEEPSGLDALERRLLAEVGTRKMEEKGRADVRSVLGISNALVPIDIPRANGGGAAEVDSAISSLTLGDEGTKVGIGKLEQERDKALERVRPPVLALDEADDLATGEEPEPDRISDERTQKQGRSISGESDRGTRKGKARSTASSGKGKERKKKKEKGQKDEEAARLRKAAKGRVVEWLGKLEPVPVNAESPTEIEADFSKAPEEVVDVLASSPPVSPLLSPVDLSDTRKAVGKAKHVTLSPDVSSPPAVPVNVSTSPILSALLDGRRPGIGRNTSVTDARHPEPAKDQKPEADDSSAAPNPRSSGFVPVSTLRGYAAGSSARSSRLPKSPTTHNSHPATPASPNNAPTSPRARYEAALRATSPSPPYSRPPPAKPIVQKRVPAFPPRPNDVQAKYDIRSARGGKGGRVTAVTAIFGSAATTNETDKQTVKPMPRSVPPAKRTPATPAPAGKHRAFLDLPRPKAVSTPRKTSPGSTPVLGPTKGTSVPAVISSSHATPMLSSTASLARPAMPQRKERAAPQPTIPEVPVVGRVASPPPAKAKRENLMFGQARLRDLIKKYQGQTA